MATEASWDKDPEDWLAAFGMQDVRAFRDALRSGPNSFEHRFLTINRAKSMITETMQDLLKSGIVARKVEQLRLQGRLPQRIVKAEAIAAEIAAAKVATGGQQNS